MQRGCTICGARFEVIDNGKYNDEKTMQQLREHLSQCTTEQPYTDDPNAIEYDGGMTQ